MYQAQQMGYEDECTEAEIDALEARINDERFNALGALALATVKTFGSDWRKQRACVIAAATDGRTTDTRQCSALELRMAAQLIDERRESMATGIVHYGNDLL